MLIKILREIIRCCTDRLVEWHENNSLIVNSKETKEIIFGLPVNLYSPLVTVPCGNWWIHGRSSSYKYGVHIWTTFVAWYNNIQYLFSSETKFHSEQTNPLCYYFSRLLTSMGSMHGSFVFMCNLKAERRDSCVSAQRFRVNRFIGAFKQYTQQRMLSLAGILHLTPLMFLQLLPSNRGFRVQHRLHWTDWRTLLFLSLSNC